MAVEKVESCRPATVAVTVAPEMACATGYTAKTEAGKMSW